MSKRLHPKITPEQLDELNLKQLNRFIKAQKSRTKFRYSDNDLGNYLPESFINLFAPYGFHPKTTQEAKTIFDYLYLSDKNNPFTVIYNHNGQRKNIILNEKTALNGWYTSFWKQMNFEQKLKIILWTADYLKQQYNLPKTEICFVAKSSVWEKDDGVFHCDANQIFINPRIILSGNFYDCLLTLVHELYHAKYRKIFNEIPTQSKLNQIESYNMYFSNIMLKVYCQLHHIPFDSDVLKAYRYLRQDETGAHNASIKIATQIHLANSKMFGDDLKDNISFHNILNDLLRYMAKKNTKTNYLTREIDKVILYETITENKNKIKKAEVFFHNFNQGFLTKEQIDKDFFKDLPVKDNESETQQNK